MKNVSPFSLSRLFPSLKSDRNSSSAAQAHNQLQLEQLEDRLMLSSVEIFAAVSTGEENLDVFIDGTYATTFESVGGDPGAREFERFLFESPNPLTADQVGVAFGNDFFDSENGIDRDLTIDRIVIDGVEFQTEHPSTHSTGIYRDGLTGPGFYETETLNVNGIFSYSEEGATNGPMLYVDAYGTTGDEILEVRIDGFLVDTFELDSTLRRFSTSVESYVAADQVQLAFTNDLYDPANGVDRNVIVQSFEINGTIVNPENSDVFSTGTWKIEDGVVPGFGRGNTLHSNGYFQLNDETPTDQGTLIRFTAQGETGTEIVQVTSSEGILLGEFVIAKGLNNRAGSLISQEYTFTTNQNVSLEDVRIAFINDGFEGDLDRNVIVETIVVEDLDSDRVQRTTTLDNRTFSTGTYLPEDGVVAGYQRGDILHTNGYFEFEESSRVVFNVYGSTNSEQYNVLVNGEVLGTYLVSDGFGVLDLDEVVTDSVIRVEFINEGVGEFGEARSLRVFAIIVDGRRHLAHSSSVDTSGDSPQYGPVALNSNGFVQFGKFDPGNIDNVTQSSVDVTYAGVGSYTLRLQRYWEKDGPISFDWTASAVDGQPELPLQQTSGTITMRDDQQYGELTIYFADTVATGAFRIDLTNPSEGLTIISPFHQVFVQAGDSPF